MERTLRCMTAYVSASTNLQMTKFVPANDECHLQYIAKMLKEELWRWGFIIRNEKGRIFTDIKNTTGV